MSETADPLPSRILGGSSLLSAGVVVIGCAGLIGSVAHVRELTSFGSAGSIRANGAACLIVLGLSIGTRAKDGLRAHLRGVGALAVLAVGLLTLAEYAVGRSFGIDELIVRGEATGSPYPPGRMAPFAASGLVFLGLGLAGLDTRSSRRVHPAELAALSAGVIALAALLEHAYGSGMVLPQAGGTAISLPTAVGLLASAGALLCARPERGAMATLIGAHLGGMLLRRALVPVGVIAALGGLACTAAVRGDMLTLPAALAMATVGFLMVAVTILVRTAFALERVDGERTALLGELEARVAQRTAGLTAASEEAERRRTSLEDALFRIRASEAALAHARDQALNLARIKNEFLGNMTHELRTPMNGVIGMLDILTDTGLDASQREYLHIARTSAVDLLAIIDDILDVTRLESGQIKLCPGPFALDDLVQQALDPWRPRAARQGLTLTAMIQTGIPQRFVADGKRIGQVLTNLVSNAVKFTRSGLVRVQVEAVASGSDWRLKLSVQDTGIGIPPERRAEMFLPFTQLDGSVTRSHGGVGLGLALCAQLVEMMDGTIGVQSEVGVGSLFSYEIPVASDAGCIADPEPVAYARTALGS